MASKRNRVELSLSDKVKLIKASNGQSVRKLADQFQCCKSTVSDILKKKNAYLEHTHVTNLNVYVWFKDVQRKGKEKMCFICVLNDLIIHKMNENSSQISLNLYL